LVAAFRRPIAHAPALLLLLYAGWRGWDTWPALDRHDDRRGEQLAARVTAGVDEQHAVLVSSMDWQSENALLYASRWERPGVVWVRLAEVLPHLPFFVADNRSLGRDIVLAGSAAANTVGAYGLLFPIVADDTVPAPPLESIVSAIPRGSPYVLCLLTPTRETAFDAGSFDVAVATLTAARAPARTPSSFEVWAGVAGEKPIAYVTSTGPFRQQFSIAGELITVRMESWLPTDTFRRAGFGHVLHGREHALIVERGVSLVWWGRDGAARTAYTAGLYGPQPRFRIPAAMMSLARASGHTPEAVR